MGLLVALEGVQVEGTPCTETAVVGLLGVGFPYMGITSPKRSGRGKPTPYNWTGPGPVGPGSLFDRLVLLILDLSSNLGKLLRVRVGSLLKGRKELGHLSHTAVKHLCQFLPRFGLLKLRSRYFPDS